MLITNSSYIASPVMSTSTTQTPEAREGCCPSTLGRLRPM